VEWCLVKHNGFTFGFVPYALFSDRLQVPGQGGFADVWVSITSWRHLIWPHATTNTTILWNFLTAYTVPDIQMIEQIQWVHFCRQGGLAFGHQLDHSWPRCMLVVPTYTHETFLTWWTRIGHVNYSLQGNLGRAQITSRLFNDLPQLFC